jgi:hypothetical protein
LAVSFDISFSERFRANWVPVRVKKTRQNKNLCTLAFVARGGGPVQRAFRFDGS